MSGMRAGVTPTGPRPRFSIVSAVYNVERYLPEFIASVERQRLGPGELQVIAVDDGSTDGSLQALWRWAETSRHVIHVLTQPNGGQASARNLGLEQATGEWVTFSDPDDVLTGGYLQAVDRFARAHPEVQVLAGRTIWLREDKGRIADLHPRRLQFRSGSRVVDLERDPNVFNGSTNVSFYRLDQVRAAGIRFDPRIRPTFEDGHFSCLYLLSLDKPVVGLVADARYLYRIRATGDSALQTSLAHPGRYTAVLEHGYLDAIAAARARFGKVPQWLQQVLVYELSWYISADEKITTGVRLADDLVPRFHELLGQVLRSLDPGIASRHRVRRLNAIWEHIIDHAYRGEPWHTPAIVRLKVDPDLGQQRLHYRSVGPRPKEAFELDGVPIEPVWQKTRAHRYYGRRLVDERILWLPMSDRLQVTLDGKPIPIRDHWRPDIGSPPRRRWRDRLWIYVRLPVANFVSGGLRRARKVVVRITAPGMRGLATLPLYRRRFAGAWVVMDRIHNADDNGQRLFEHLRDHRPDINAWFVLERGSPEWKRLRRQVGSRLVAYGSFRWKMLMQSCRWLVSSHADQAVVEPRAALALARDRPWKFAFLQHGVIKDDLSLWLNHRDIDLFVVSTAAELESVAGDGTGYVVTHKETQLTGLPRFDRLLAKGRAVDPADRRMILISPTWRTSLATLDPESQMRDIDPRFWSSAYYRSWDAILRSEEIAAAAAKRGWQVGFMPHPNMQPILRAIELPAHVVPLTFDGNDVQDLYARCALMVTDYSSVAFNVAYLDRPIVYFQFDRDEMMSGGHIGRRGYFDYERDGFGPVADDPEDAIRAIVASIEAGAAPSPEYQARIDRTFVVRDGRACERVIAAIEALDGRTESH